MTARMVLRFSSICQVSSTSLVLCRSVRFTRPLRSLPGQALQRQAEVIDHGVEITGQRGAAPDQHIIMVRPHRHGVDPPDGLAKPAADAIAFGGGAVLLSNGETDPNRAQIIAAAALQGERIGVDPRTMGNGEEVRALP